MDILRVTTTRCPCCKYEYQVTEHMKKIQDCEVKSIVRNGKKVASQYVLNVARDCYNQTGSLEKIENFEDEILRKMFSGKCKLEPKKKGEFKYISISKELTAGKEEFIPVSHSHGYEARQEVKIAHECPNCGIYLDINKCITVKEE